MRGFFNYESFVRMDNPVDMNIIERIIPILVIGFVIYVIFRYKDVLKSDKIDKIIRYLFGSIFLIVYSSHYILYINMYGWNDTIILPFHLCGMAMFLAIILIFFKTRKLHAFVLVAGGLGALVSLAYPILGYNSMYYRYYQFYIAHGLLLITPIYFMVVHDYMPKVKDFKESYYIMLVLAFFIVVFNSIFGTDFWFLITDPAKITLYPMIKYFGGIPYYIVTVVLMFSVYLWGVSKFFEKVLKIN